MRMGKPNKSRRRRKSKSSSSSSSSTTSKTAGGAATTKTAELNNKPKYSSPNIIVGQVSSNVIASILSPKLMDCAIQSLELYAEESLLYSDYLKELDKRRMKDEESKGMVGEDEEEDEGVEEAEINLDGTSTTTTEKTQDETSTPTPTQLPPLEPVQKPKPILFTSQRLIDEFQNEILIPTSKHFSVHTNTWKVYANAAKFERLLDEKYGLFRPFITQHPEIETFFRGVQRKYAMGYFSPFRQGEAPLNITSSIVLLFMMQRNKIRWDGIILTALFLLVGLQPWALVTGVSLVQWRLWRRRGRKVGSMGMMRRLQVIRPYYAKERHVGKKKKDEQEEKGEDEPTSKQLKMDILKQPVGTKISTDTTIDDTSNYDTILLGYGPSTLYTAALLSRAGRKVLVLSPMDDASGCVTLSIPPNDTTKLNKKYDTIPFDIHNNNVTKISKQQKLLVPALCTDSDCQGGIRFVQIGSQSDGYAHEILCIPGMGCGSDNTDDAIPFVLRGNGTNLADDAAQYLGDGWVGSEPNNPGNSATAAYLQVCNAMNASAGQYYQSKLLSDSVQNLQSKSSYHEACIRYAGSFLDKCLPLNPHVRSLMAGIGMREENIKPSKLSMGPHVSNISGVTCGEGMHYPMGGPRALCHALRSVVEQCGGTVLTGVELKELVFENEDDEEDEAEEEESKKKGKKNRKGKADTTKKEEEGDKPQQQQQPTTPSPRCIGVTLANGQTLTLNNTENDSNIEPAIISTLGFIPTFIHLFPDAIRMKHGVPRGFPALTERRPTIQVLVGLKGSAQTLNLTGADYYRLPNASLARDVMDGETGQVKLGEIGLPDYDNDDDAEGEGDGGEDGEKKICDEDENIDATTTAPTAGDTPSSSSGNERAGKRDKRSKSTTTISISTTSKKQRKTKFETGSSWLKISFPSAKDPTFPSRHGTDVTTCVVTIEADDDFVKFFDAKPKLYSIHRRVGGGQGGQGGGESARLMERVMKDLVDIYPQLEGKIECAQIRGPHRTGLSHTPERYAAKGIRPDTSYPGLYVGGSDLTIGDSFSAGIIGGWLVANAVMGYTYVDHLFLEKNITSDLERWLDEPKKKRGKGKKGKDVEEEEEDVAVPYSPPPPARTADDAAVSVPEDKAAGAEEEGGGGGESSGEQQESGEGETTAESSKEK